MLTIGLIVLGTATVFQPATKADLQASIDLFISDPVASFAQHGNITRWDVSLVSDMSSEDTFTGVRQRMIAKR